MNEIKFKSKKYHKNITAVLGKYNIVFQIEEKPGLKRNVDLLLPADDYDITVLLDELNGALPKHIAVAVENGMPKYLKRC